MYTVQRMSAVRVFYVPSLICDSLCKHTHNLCQLSIFVFDSQRDTHHIEMSRCQCMKNNNNNALI